MAIRRILIAGIGNIFLGDDAFGVEVLRRLTQQTLPVGVCAIDFGIRGFDLACAIMDDYDAVILVDALPRGGEPGTLYVLEPELDGFDRALSDTTPDGHTLTPTQVLGWVKAMGGRLPLIRVVGCEPATFGDDDNPQMELSPAVSAAVEQALPLIRSLASELAEAAAVSGSPT